MGFQTSCPLINMWQCLKFHHHVLSGTSELDYPNREKGPNRRSQKARKRVGQHRGLKKSAGAQLHHTGQVQGKLGRQRILWRILAAWWVTACQHLCKEVGGRHRRHFLLSKLAVLALQDLSFVQSQTSQAGSPQNSSAYALFSLFISPGKGLLSQRKKTEFFFLLGLGTPCSLYPDEKEEGMGAQDLNSILV